MLVEVYANGQSVEQRRLHDDDLAVEEGATAIVAA